MLPVKIRLDWCHVFSYQSLMPAVAGTPRYENWVHRSIEGFRCRLCPPPHGWGQPQPYISLFDPGLSLFGTVVGVAGRRRKIPDRSPGPCVSRTNRSCRLSPAHQGLKIGCIG